MEGTVILATGKHGHVYHNWAHTFTCRPELYFEPKTRDELRRILLTAKSQRKKVRVVGNGRSPSEIPCSKDYMVSMKHFDKVTEIDRDTGLVKVEAGILIRDLNQILSDNNLAISVCGSIDHVTLGGAIATGTHGTGAKYPIMAHYVQEIEFMLANGELLRLSRNVDGDRFLAAVVNVGCLGVMLSIVYQCEPAFKLENNQWPAKLQDILEHLDVHLSASDHFRFMWYPHTDGVVAYHMKRTEKPVKRQGMLSWFWNYAVGYHLLQLLYWICSFMPSLVARVNQLYYRVLGSQSVQVVDHSHNLFSIECLFWQYVTEWAIPRENAVQVLLELKAWIENSSFPSHFPVEVRFVKGDDFLLSPANGRDSCYINILSYKLFNKTVPYEEYWNAFENIVKSAGGRPHWAKAVELTVSELRTMYPGLEKFCELRRVLDPEGLFLNPYLAKWMAPESSNGHTCTSLESSDVGTPTTKNGHMSGNL